MISVDVARLFRLVRDDICGCRSVVPIDQNTSDGNIVDFGDLRNRANINLILSGFKLSSASIRFPRPCVISQILMVVLD